VPNKWSYVPVSKYKYARPVDWPKVWRGGHSPLQLIWFVDQRTGESVYITRDQRQPKLCSVENLNQQLES